MLDRPKSGIIKVRRKTPQLSLDAWLKQAQQIRAQVADDIGTRQLPDIAEILRQSREERDDDCDM